MLKYVSQPVQYINQEGRMGFLPVGANVKAYPDSLVTMVNGIQYLGVVAFDGAKRGSVAIPVAAFQAMNEVDPSKRKVQERLTASALGLFAQASKAKVKK